MKSSLCCLCLLAGALGRSSAIGSDRTQLETACLQFTVAGENGGYEIEDKVGGVTWRSNPYHARFGEIAYQANGHTKSASLSACQVESVPRGLDLTFHPIPTDANATVRVTVRAGEDEKSLGFSYDASPDINLESIRMLDDALWLADSEQGYAAVPVREGMLVPANSQLSFTHRFDTFAYEGCHMEMMGVVKSGAAVLLTWHDPYVAAELRSVLTNAVWVHGQQVLSPSLVLRKSANSFRLQFLGKGGYDTLAKGYREAAREKGWLVSWDEKLKGHPERVKLFGAINFKLWSTLDRRMNEASTKEERVSVNWTFDEAAQVAEHLKKDLQLDKVLFIMGGWIHRGYDNQHPDILPTAPECGGDEAFAACAKRVRQLGYLFCLHDNYQDIYRDSPSWNEDLIMKNRDGTLSRGGHWAGGMAYLTCSQKALELAERAQNLRAVQQLCGADAYFIDTTYAAGLQECFDPQHPLTRWDDMKWKQALSDYSRDVFGIFGSECGREWAVPHSDFFEGLSGVSGRSYHDSGLLNKLGGVVIPLFEMVYRDCIAIYGKYGYDPAQAAEYVLHHISIGRPLNYHNIPPHLYWQEPARHAEPLSVRPAIAKLTQDGERSYSVGKLKINAEVAVFTPEPAPPAKVAGDRAIFTRANNGWAEGLHPMDRFVKNTAEILSPLNELTSQVLLTSHEFLTSDRKVERTVFGTGEKAVEVIVNSNPAEFETASATTHQRVVLPPYGFLVNSAQFVAFNALEYEGIKYPSPTLFTLRSLDGKNLARSARVRVFHGFGSADLHFGGKTRVVERDAILTAAE